MAKNNLLSWFSASTKNRELADTRAAWERTERLYRALPLGTADVESLASDVVRQALAECERIPTPAILSALCEATETLLRAESITDIEPLWGVIETNVEAAVEFRDMLRRRERWALDFGKMWKVWGAQLGISVRTFVSALPESCFTEEAESPDTFAVPLIDLLLSPAEVVDAFVHLPYAGEALSLGIFAELRFFIRRNLLKASDLTERDIAKGHERDFILPLAQSGKGSRELSDLYLARTPLAVLLNVSVPFTIPEEVRFEHCHIIGGTGHGKTQLLQKMIYADFVASQHDRRSVVVLDSQGDLIRKLSRLELFSPYVPEGLGDRLVLIDPSDVEYPVALNLFDAHLERLQEYDPADRERVMNGVVELYETFFDALLGSELTARQDVVFRYIARLMVTIPNATVHTLMAVMENGKTFKPYMEKLEGSARRFFETEFFSPSFAATKGQILKRLWGVLSIPAFDRMFSQKENKLDLFEALNGGKIILVNTAKDVLKEEGSRIFGRFFIAMLAQAALERAAMREKDRTPTFVYVDEAHEYFDDRIEAILNQARKFKVGLTLAHQTLDQLSPRLRSVLLANTSIKCAGGTSSKDAHAIAGELHTTPEYIEGMRRKGPTTEFALWIKNMTPQAIRLSVPLGFLERQYTLDEEGYELLLQKNRERYCGTVAEPIAILREAQAQSESAPVTPIAVSVSPVAEQEDTRSVFPPVEIPERGKGGAQHRYLQSLIRELGAEAGLKATVEAPLQSGGQVDVLLERDGLVAAIEISVSTPVEHERENIRKCLASGVPRVAVVLAKSPAVQERYRTAIAEYLTADDLARVSFLAPQEIPEYLASLAPPPATETIVRGYKVKVSHAALSPEEARAKREAVAKVIARSLGGSGA